MLLQFSCSNFLSIKDPIVLSMIASSRKELKDSNVFTFEKFNLLKSVVLYGANASGKTNIVSALGFAKKFVINSAKTQSEDVIRVKSFKLNSEFENEASHFEFIFIHAGVRYRYGFQLNQVEVKSEWLFHAPQGRESKLFIRQGQRFDLANDFKEGKGLEEKTRKNALYLSVVAQFNGRFSMTVLEWFRKCKVISSVNDQSSLGFTLTRMEDDKFKKQALEFLKAADLGIEDFNIVTQQFDPGTLSGLPENVVRQIGPSIKALPAPGGMQHFLRELKTIHKKYGTNNELVGTEQFELGVDESAGTKKLFALSGPILDTLEKGNLLIIDELDSMLHPALMYFIIRLFNSKDKNPNNAQLIFTCHNINILDKKNFRRDQVWFVEKDRYGSSKLFSLLEYKIRNTASFGKDYMGGKYGAIPLIKDVNLPKE